MRKQVIHLHGWRAQLQERLMHCGHVLENGIVALLYMWCCKVIAIEKEFINDPWMRPVYADMCISHALPHQQMRMLGCSASAHCQALHRHSRHPSPQEMEAWHCCSSACSTSWCRGMWSLLIQHLWTPAAPRQWQQSQLTLLQQLKNDEGNTKM